MMEGGGLEVRYSPVAYLTRRYHCRPLTTHARKAEHGWLPAGGAIVAPMVKSLHSFLKKVGPNKGFPLFFVRVCVGGGEEGVGGGWRGLEGEVLACFYIP